MSMTREVYSSDTWQSIDIGRYDLFLHSRTAAFSPVLLASFVAGDFVPPLPSAPLADSDIELMPRTRGGCELRSDPPSVDAVERWFKCLAEQARPFDENDLEPVAYTLAPAASLTVSAPTPSASADTVCWIRLLPDCPANLDWKMNGVPVPGLKPGDWIAAPPGMVIGLPVGARFAVSETDAVPGVDLDDICRQATAHICTVIGSMATDRGQESGALDHDIDVYETKALHTELSRFVRIFGRASGKVRFETPLLKALAFLGRHAGFAVPRTAEKYKEKTLDAICRRANLFVQPVEVSPAVLLATKEALLAFDGDNPFVILPGRNGRAQLYDPVEEVIAALGPEQATSLAAQAVSVAPLLPEKAISFRQFLLFGATANWRDAAAMVAAGLGSAVLAMAIPYGMGVAFSRVVPSSLGDKLIQLVLALLLIAAVAFFLDRSSTISALRMQGKTALLTNNALWHRLLRFPGSFFGGYGTGDLMQRLSVAGRMHNSVQTLFHGLVVRGQHFLASLFVMATLFPLMALMMFGMVMLLFTASALTVYLQRRTIAEGEAFRGSAFNQTIELVGGISKIKAAGAERWAFNQWAHNFSELRSRSMRSRAINTTFQSVSSGVHAVALLIIFLVISRSVTAGEQMDAGLYLAFIAALGTFMSASVALAHMGSRIAPLIGQRKRVKPFLETIPVSEAHKRDPGPLKGHVSVDGVSFRYDENGPWVLDNVSLSVAPGQSIAIVGDSGSGKSTLLRLILGALEPELGSIHFDGKDRRGLLNAALRSQVAAVTQLGEAMPGSLYDNIRGASNCTIDEAWAAVEAASLVDDIRAMPMGMQTQITQGASNFSGGQIQRLMVARAIASRPRVLLLDEATSALDEPTQAKVIQALDAMTVTRIVVAHRLSTIRQADQIFVLKDGKIVESGGFEELATSGGVFARMVRPATSG